MEWLIGTSLRLRVVVVALAGVLAAAGIWAIDATPLDVFPEFAPPLVEIQTEAPGLSTSEVEALISVPLENALNGVSWLQTIRSTSVLGLSSVRLIFEDGTDLLRARQLVQERLAVAAASLPSIAHPPVMLSPLSSTSRVLKIGISSDSLSQMEMTTLARWTIRPRLMAVPGVANVAIWGQRDRQLQVLVDPDRLHANGVTLDDVRRAAGDATTLASGGFIDTPNQRFAVTHGAAVSSPEELAAMTVKFTDGTAVTLGDVAEVVLGTPPPIGDAIINDGPGLLLIVEKQPWGNTLEVTRNIETTLEEMRPALTGLEIDPTIFRPATFIEMSIHNLNISLLIGCLLVILVLALFLNDWRTAVISIVTIPLSLLTAILLLHYRGGTIDTMVLAGLLIALGEVVDDAIIDVENILRRLRLNRSSDSPRSIFRVVLEASLEVRSAVVFGSLIVILVLLPVFLLPGLAGSFFQPLALSYILAISASLFIALTVTPALSFFLLPAAAERREDDTRFVVWLKKHYRRLLPRAIERPERTLTVLGVVFACSLVVVPFLGEEFLPDFKEYDFLMHWVEKPGTSIEAMDRITLRVSRELRAIDGVRNFGSHIGRAEVADEVVGPNFTELWISLDPEADYDASVAEIQEVVNGYPGLYRDVLTYLRERIKEVLTGTSASVVVRLYGPELPTLIEKGNEIGDALESIEGVTDLAVQQLEMIPQIEVHFRPDAAAAFGLTPGDVRSAVTTMVKGSKVGEIYEDQKYYDVTVWGVPEARGNLEGLRNLKLHVPGGGVVPLSEVADVYVAASPNAITRESASRRIDVTCNVAGRDLGGVVQDIQERLQNVSFEPGYYPEVLGEYAEREAASRRLQILALFSLVGIFLILHADFRSTRLALIVLLSLPFALTGSVMAALFSGGVLSLGSMVGFVTVLGIAARNGIMLISHYRYLQHEEGEAFGKALIFRGAEERLAPILMTALTTAFALLPIILGGIRPGHEIEHPMAVVIVGGLVTSAVLNLFLLPALYWRYAEPRT